MSKVMGYPTTAKVARAIDKAIDEIKSRPGPWERPTEWLVDFETLTVLSREARHQAREEDRGIFSKPHPDSPLCLGCDDAGDLPIQGLLIRGVPVRFRP